MKQGASYIPVHKSDLVVGRPLPWTVYDGSRNLLLRQGVVLETQTQVDALLENGLSRRDERAVGETGKTGATEADAGRSLPLDEIKLTIGDALQIQTQVDHAEARYYVKLIGYLKGKSILVTVPEIDGRLCFVREGQSFVVRLFSGKSAYAFSANVLRSTSVPFPHMYLSYPSMVRGLVVRTGERIPVRIICTVARHDGTKTVSSAGVLTNMSVGGALLSSKTSLGRKGELLSVKFRVAIRGIEFLAAIDATICAVSRDETEDFLHGIQFVGLSDEVAIALTAFVYQNLAEASR